MDGVFDDYVIAPLTRMVLNALRDEDKRDPYVGAEAKATLDKSYAWLNHWMAGREWTANNIFGIADCAAAPALSTPTGGTRSQSPTRHFGIIAHVCSLVRRSLGSSTKRGRGARSSHSRGTRTEGSAFKMWPPTVLLGAVRKIGTNRVWQSLFCSRGRLSARPPYAKTA
jgi:hypothetical protein